MAMLGTAGTWRGCISRHHGAPRADEMISSRTALFNSRNCTQRKLLSARQARRVANCNVSTWWD